MAIAEQPYPTAASAASLRQDLQEIGLRARAASNALRSLTRAPKDAALRNIAHRLREATEADAVLRLLQPAEEEAES